MLLLEYSSSNKSTVVDLATATAANEQLGQRFKLYRPASIGRISLYLSATGSPTGYLWAEIRQDSSNNPSDMIIENGQSLGVACGSVGSIAYVNFDFDESARPFLDADNYYHIVLRSSGYTYTDETTEISWGADQSSPSYINGEGETYNGTTWSDISTDTDFCFQLYSGTRAVYSSLRSVEAVTRHLTNNGFFTDSTAPDVSAVMGFEEMITAEIDSWLAGAAFETPVTDTTIISWLKPYANAGVAMWVEMTARGAGFRGESGSDTRAGAFRTLYWKLRDGLKEDGEFVDALVAMGLTRESSGQLGRGLSAGGISSDELETYQTDDDDVIQPFFSRTMWDNP